MKHLNETEQIIKLGFYLGFQNAENFALSASSNSLNLKMNVNLRYLITFYPFTNKTLNS